MRDQARFETLKSRIHSLEMQSRKLRKQLSDVSRLLDRLLDDMGDKDFVEIQKPHRDKLS